MPVIIACPSCGGKLRVADELRGQPVRCPACNHTFAPAPPTPPEEPRPVPQDLPLDLALDEPAAKGPAPANGSPGLVGAVELKLSLDDEPSTPAPPSPPPPAPASRRPRLAHEHDEDYPDIVRRRGPRRDAVPDRGATVLSLGIISLACLMITCFPIGLILGLIAWLMGRADLGKINRGAMDETGRGMTQAGWICGILGTLLNGLLTLGCLGLIGFMVYMDTHRPLPSPRPTVAPAPAPQWPPPNQKGPGRKFWPPPNQKDPARKF